ncbi:MAG: hypothetical protein HC896_04740 [Bacteroidales bacterium]|nr:hypothetical protein [Bacteroidales bacterium]
MELKEALRISISRQIADLIATSLINAPEKIKELIEIIGSNDEKRSARATYVLMRLDEEQPALLYPHLDRLIELLPGIPYINSMARVIRVFINAPIKERHEDVLAGVCFDLMERKLREVSPKVYAMEVLYRLSGKYAEIKTELAALIEAGMPTGTAGYKNRGTKILKKLKKRTGNDQC